MYCVETCGSVGNWTNETNCRCGVTGVITLPVEKCKCNFRIQEASQTQKKGNFCVLSDCSFIVFRLQVDCVQTAG